jgi:preprotein translocase subunit SecA
LSIISGLLNRITGSSDDQIKRLKQVVDQINILEPSFGNLPDADLKKTSIRLSDALSNGKTLDDILPEAFAAVREASKRTIGMRHYDVQLMGGIVLHQGKIAEMKTGEGKTLVATLPLYLNAIQGNGAHLITVNDYLARRDAQWMGPIYHSLGLTLATLQHNASFLYDPEFDGGDTNFKYLRPATRQEAYAADITYGTNNEFGFDYLRDNMAVAIKDVVQRNLNFAIVDEVDNILIDEARTPLIISGSARQSTKMYYTMAKLVPRLIIDEDYNFEEKERTVVLTEDGMSNLERLLNVDNLYDPQNYVLTHYVENALRANVAYQRDKDYVVQQGEVIIVDEFTGRLMPGRRYAEGLHQAIEAKENIQVRQESLSYATITLQNYFRMHSKLSGMTGTASTEGEEFWKIYKLDVIPIPTNKVMIREDLRDAIYKNEDSKFQAVANKIDELNKERRPVLVGTTSIEASERLSNILKRRGVVHQILNAKQHEKEASIIAQAGRLGAVTVATNMAGRGTDIVLGGFPEGRGSQDWEEENRSVIDLGGLYIIGTERHEARRIDNQLRGRAGRQGDPGSTKFYISLEDELMRRFGGERVKKIMEWAGLEDDVPVESRMVSKAIESSQVKVEAFNFDVRKHLVDYDDVANAHRDVIYADRHRALSEADLKHNIKDMIHNELDAIIGAHTNDRDNENWSIDTMEAELVAIMPLPANINLENIENMRPSEMFDALSEHADILYEENEAKIGSVNMRTLERILMLRVIDSHWIEHLTSMQNLRQGIGLQAYGQRDPLVMYKKEAHVQFGDLLGRIQHDVVHTIFRVGATSTNEFSRGGSSSRGPVTSTKFASNSLLDQAATKSPVNGAGLSPSGFGKVGRNDTCPCGSGKKFKKCHAALV